jgi:hypothetical protein
VVGHVVGLGHDAHASLGHRVLLAADSSGGDVMPMAARAE